LPLSDQFLEFGKTVYPGRPTERRSVSTNIVSSFSFSFQFFTRLAAVFAEEVGDFSSDYKRDWEIIRI
jgi:hypothetical protein